MAKSNDRTQPKSGPTEVHFKISAGEGIKIENSSAEVFGITSGKPVSLWRGDVGGVKFSANFASSKYDYCYAVTSVRTYRYGGKRHEAGDRVLQLVSVFPAGAEHVALNEHLTVATAYCFAQFASIGAAQSVEISDPNGALKLAYGMKNNFAETGTGAVRVTTPETPSAMERVSPSASRKIVRAASPAGALTKLSCRVRPSSRSR